MEWNLVLCLDDFGKRNEPIHKLLSHHFFDDVLVVIVAQCTAQFVVVHVLFILADAPQARHFLRAQQFEFTIVVCPFDDVTVLVA